MNTVNILLHNLKSFLIFLLCYCVFQALLTNSSIKSYLENYFSYTTWDHTVVVWVTLAFIVNLYLFITKYKKPEVNKGKSILVQAALSLIISIVWFALVVLPGYYTYTLLGGVLT